MLRNRIAARFGLTVLVAALSVGVMAQEGKQAPETRDVGLAAIVKGAGATYQQISVTNVGRLSNYVSPAGSDHVFYSDYNLCTGVGDYLGSANFAPVSIVQPGGAGTLPLTVTTRTNDNNWQIAWKYSVSGTNLKGVELMVDATVKRLFSPTAYAYLGMRGDFDMDNDLSEDSADTSTGNAGSTGWMRDLHALTILGYTRTLDSFSYTHNQYGGAGCFPSAQTRPYGGDGGISTYYYLGNLAVNASKKVQFQWQRQ